MIAALFFHPRSSKTQCFSPPCQLPPSSPLVYLFGRTLGYQRWWYFSQGTILLGLRWWSINRGKCFALAEFHRFESCSPTIWYIHRSWWHNNHWHQSLQAFRHIVGWNTYTGPLHLTSFGTKAPILLAWRDCMVSYQFSHGKGKGSRLHLLIAMGCSIFHCFRSFSWKIHKLQQIYLPSIVAVESLCHRIPGSESGMQNNCSS